MKKNINLNQIQSFPRIVKLSLIILIDIFLCFFSLWLSFFLRLDIFISFNSNLLILGVLLSLSLIFFLVILGSYKSIFRYSGTELIKNIFFSFIFYGSSVFLVLTLVVIDGVPRSIGVLQPMILFFLISFSRLIANYLLNYSDKKKLIKRSNILIYGAGNAGFQVAAGLQNNNNMHIVGFVDDDSSLHKRTLLGHKIYSPYKIKDIIKSKNISYILLAIPSINISARKKIIEKISHHKVAIVTLPNLNDLYKGIINVSDINKFNVEDLLERNVVQPISHLLDKNIVSQVVMVTGAGGSIGSELCKQIIKLNPSKLVLIENNEFALYKIQSELNDLLFKYSKFNEIKIFSFLVSIQDKKKISDIMKKIKPDTIYHSAAYKHVPIVEENICISLKNNIFGTLNLIKSSIDNDVSTFVLISSDKAVRPTNIMGVSKRIAEICLQSISRSSKSIKTKFSAVRFGNVLISSGSVIPKFINQIKLGGPITLTHSEVTRYFMTVSEAAQLVIQAGALGNHGDIFVLDMGQPIKIKDLILRLIKLSGYSYKDEENPDGDISIKVVGLRPGEKLHEELLIGESPMSTGHPKIQKLQDSFISWNELDEALKDLNILIENEKIDEIIILLKKLVKGYSPSKVIKDNLYTIN